MSVSKQLVQYTRPVPGKQSALRERKKERTRLALVEAAVSLFESSGYEGATIADIAAAADVAPRTFFAYFPTKEDVFFADTEARIALALSVIDERAPGDRLSDVLGRLVDRISEDGNPQSELFRRLAPVRARLMMREPAVQGHALRRLFGAQRRLAERLRLAYPEILDEVTAAAVVGSFVGALLGAAMTALGTVADGEPPAELSHRALSQLRKGLEVALRGIAALDEPGR
jgi:AcrR family transcriptional regulator